LPENILLGGSDLTGTNTLAYYGTELITAIKGFTAGATTFSITTLGITTLGIMTLSVTTLGIKTLVIKTLSIMTLCIKTLGIMGLFATICANGTRHK
jgi:hypothetical protein